MSKNQRNFQQRRKQAPQQRQQQQREQPQQQSTVELAPTVTSTTTDQPPEQESNGQLQNDTLTKRLNNLFGAHPSSTSTPGEDTQRRIVFLNNNSQGRNESYQDNYKYLLRLYTFTIVFVAHAVAQFILLHKVHQSHTGRCYMGLTWFCISLVLCWLFLSFDELRFGFPANWVVAVLIMLSLTFSIGMMAIVDSPNLILWTAMWTAIALISFLTLGLYVPKRLGPNMWIIIVVTIFANVGIFSIILMHWLFEVHVAAHVLRFTVLFWALPFILYHSQLVHGKRQEELPTKDLPLAVIFLFTDFIVIYVGLFWSEGIASAIIELYNERLRESSSKFQTVGDKVDM